MAGEKRENRFTLNYGDGDFSMVDERVYKLVREFKEKEDFVKRLQTRWSSFDELEEYSYQIILTLSFNTLVKVQL